MLAWLTACVACISVADAEVLHFIVAPSASEVSASVSEPMSSLRGEATGTFRIISGEIEGDPASPARTSRVKIVLDATSYSSGTALRDRSVTHSTLQSDIYPTITFEAHDVDNIVMSGEGYGVATLVGPLNLHGVSRPVVVPFTAVLREDKLEVSGELTLRYTDFGMQAPSLMFGALSAGDQASIHFHLFATRSPR